MSVICDCPRASLCKLCFDQRVTWLTGVARARGEWWAQDVARAGRAEPVWLITTARTKVADLAGEDPRVLEQLAKECAAYAARRWGQLQVRE